MKHPPVVYVEWLDASHLSAGWQDRREMLSAAKAYYQPTPAVGFLLQDGPEYLVLCAAYNPQNDDAGHGFLIPRSEIKKIVRLRPGKGFEKDAA